MPENTTQTKNDKRFAFGENWRQFLSAISDERIKEAKESMCTMLNVASLEGKTFIDVGSGSGLFSLVARSLGAKVVSFDYDVQSVACTTELKRRYFPDDDSWIIEQGSVLDKNYLEQRGVFDVVYSWGVLHHTGHLKAALENVMLLVGPNGLLFIAIYNDQGVASRIWLSIKETYNSLPHGLRWIVLMPSFIRLWLPTIIRDCFCLKPFRSWKMHQKERGMSPWRDVVDWVGGYPFEVAKPEEIFQFYRAHGFRLEKLKTRAGGLGCNEFVFRRTLDR